MKTYTVESLTLEPEDIEADAPILAAQKHAVVHELQQGTIVRVRILGRVSAYKVGRTPRQIRPMGRPSSPQVPKRRGMIQERRS